MNDEYFKKWLDEKFDFLAKKIDAINDTTSTEISRIDKRIEDLERDQKWAASKILVAMGGIVVISAFGTYFILSFKSLNELQIQSAVEAAFTSRADKLNREALSQ